MPVNLLLFAEVSILFTFTKVSVITNPLKQDWFKSALSRFRAVALTEGISFLVLLLIAMPLKYLAGFPDAVKVVGWAHGVLFIAYLITLAHVTIIESWSFLRVVLAFIASLIPFGTFILDKQLNKEEKAVIK